MDSMRKTKPRTRLQISASSGAACVAAALIFTTQAAVAHAQNPSAPVANDAAPVRIATATSVLEPRQENGKLIYEAAVFSSFAPQTAGDMVRQIPGFSITDLSNDRGLGEASQNVLINGARISGKSNDARSVLGRISAASVIRFEIVDGATLDITGLSGQVLNVVTRPDALSGNFKWSPQFRKRMAGNVLGGEINLSGKLGAGDFTLGLANKDAFRGGGWGPEINTDKNGILLYTRDRFGRFNGDRPSLTASYSLKSGTGAALNINATGQLFKFRGRTEYDRFAPTGPHIIELETNTENESNYELSGDYEAALWGGKLKLIGYHRFEHSPGKGEFRRDFLGLQPVEADRYDQVVDEGETVIRSEYRWKSGKSDWQVSLESAKNFLDSTLALSTLDAQGNFNAVAFDGANARVEEKRGQLVLSYGRPLGSKLNMQLSLGGEYSQLSQSGGNGRTRSFWRPKGSASLAYKASPALDLSFKLQRKVGQLNFGDFLASVDLQNSNDNAGNPDLVPPQSWLGEFELNRSLGKSGSVKLKLTGEVISDLVDQIPITAITEAPGNLPSARRANAELTATLLLDRFGAKGAKLDFTGRIERSQVKDPVTGIDRQISEQTDYGYEIQFRHDIPSTNWAYGVTFEHDRQAPFFRLSYTAEQYKSRPGLHAFIENKDVYGLKLRAQIINILNGFEQNNETFYVARRDGPLSRFVSTPVRYGFIYRFQVSGTF
jgi:outer membrane receptor for ferrienterochelin and colicins